MTVKTLPLVFEAPRRGKPPTHWFDLTVDERIEAAQKLGLPKFRADQISRHVFDRLEDDVNEFSDIPASIRADLGEQLFPNLLEQVTHRSTDDGATVKTLWKLHDGSLLESVLMRYPNRTTLCISSQAGCGMACPFCA
ncbi:MAG: 23S rRNA (adenine(2503)-C(2))-methyltransferase RlmN, partial [Propionibacteriaceae bacterium]|nr:23S rRNA (adenine(2503)-C(2))-methyltransferase RlmN [Propionibacteriaceae bacterium]